MKKIRFSIHINASQQKVWETLIGDKTYRQWTAPFNPEGSYYEGQWVEGTTMRFLGPDSKGVVSGMLSRIKTVRPFEFISIQHLGEIHEGKEKLWTAEESGPNGAFENYTLTEKDGGTEVFVELDTNEELEKMFEDMWPKALAELKRIAEK